MKKIWALIIAVPLYCSAVSSLEIEEYKPRILSDHTKRRRQQIGADIPLTSQLTIRCYSEPKRDPYLVLVDRFNKETQATYVSSSGEGSWYNGEGITFLMPYINQVSRR